MQWWRRYSFIHQPSNQVISVDSLHFPIPPFDVYPLLLCFRDSGMIYPGLPSVPLDSCVFTLIDPPDHSASSSATDSASFLLRQYTIPLSPLLSARLYLGQDSLMLLFDPCTYLLDGGFGALWFRLNRVMEIRAIERSSEKDRALGIGRYSSAGTSSNTYLHHRI